MRRRTAARVSVWVSVGLLAALCLEHSAAGQPGDGKPPRGPADGQLRAGTSTTDVTPPRFPVSLVGSFSDRKATSAHDPLAVRCLVLGSGDLRLAIAVVDVCILPRDVCDEAKRLASASTGIPADRMLIAATHTHTAPPTTVLNDIRVEPDYLKLLTGRIAEAIEQAARRLAPARAGWGSAQVPEEVSNRRWFMKEGTIPPNPFGGTDQVQMNPAVASPNLMRPAGPTDPEVSVLSVQSAEGRAVALLANYSLHYVGDVPAATVSADYFGEFCRQVESRLTAAGQTPPLAMLTNGTSGDVNNIDFRNPRKQGEIFSRIRHVAGRIAEAALTVRGRIEHRDGLPLAMAERDIDLAVRKASPAELERARQILARTDDKGLPRLARYYADQAVRLSRYPDTVKVKLQAIRIGELGIVAIPCEVFAEIGLEIKKRSPLRPTFVIDLANGYHGYLPSPEQHAVGGYETWAAASSYLEVNASRKITTAVLELLGQVAAAPPKGP
jgi:neutral ceramidase